MFRNGVRAYFSANKNTVTHSTHELAGPKGKILYDIVRDRLVRHPSPGRSSILRKVISRTTRPARRTGRP